MYSKGRSRKRGQKANLRSCRQPYGSRAFIGNLDKKVQDPNIVASLSGHVEGSRIVVPKLSFDLPRPFKLEGIQRQDDTPQHKAVREAFTNSIIHSDVFLSGGILRIEKHDDRLVLRNPGTLKLPLSKIIEGGSSKARNPRMQNMLRMIGYGENIGSGFPQILNAWKLAGWKEPVLEDRWDVQEVQLTMYVTRKNVAVNTKYLSEELGVNRKTIQRDLASLQALNLIKWIGADKDGHWELIK